MWKPKFLTCGDKPPIEPTAAKIVSEREREIESEAKIVSEREREIESEAKIVSERESEKVSLKAPAMIDFSGLKPCFREVQGELFHMPGLIVLQRFVKLFETGLPGVSFLWEDIYKDPFSRKLLDASHIPQPVYAELEQWVTLLMDDEELRYFVAWSFNYIVDAMFDPPAGVKRFQNVSIFLALAVVLRTAPHVFLMDYDYLKKHQLAYNRRNIETTPLIVWMTLQVSRTNFRLGVQAWVLYLLPLLSHCNPHSTTHTESMRFILILAFRIMKDPDADATVTSPFFRGYQLIPPPSLEPLLKFRFLARGGDSLIYTWFKDAALKGAPEKDEIMQQIFTVSFGLVGEENPGLAEEAAAIAIWSLTKNDACWEHWNSLCLSEQNLEASVDLLEKLVEKWNDQSLKPSSPSRKAMNHQFVQQIFNVSLRLAGKGCSVSAKKASAIAIWSLTENIDCWKRCDHLYKENMEASLVLLQELEEKWNEHSLKLLSSPTDTLTLSQTIRSFRLKNKKNNDFLYKEADKSCKVISRRLSRGITSLKCTCITAVVIVTAVAAAAALVLPESVFGFYK